MRNNNRSIVLWLVMIMLLTASMTFIARALHAAPRQPDQTSSDAEGTSVASPSELDQPLARELRATDTTSIVFRVTIERVVATNNFDGPFGFDRADFFGRVRIDTLTQESQVISNHDDISPAWEFANTVLLDDTIDDEVVTLTIGVWDSDNWNNAQEADLTSTSDRSLNLNVKVSQCLTNSGGGTVSGSGINGQCGQTLVSQGYLGEGAFNTARIEFRIEADRPPTAPGLQVLCMHEPLWPQPGNLVTVNATAMSDNMAPKVADKVEIFLQNNTSPATSCGIEDECSASAAASGDSLFYGCQVQDGANTVWSGWRRVQVGMPPAGQRAVPVIYTGPSRSRVDIVFVPDVDNFPNPADPFYLEQVRMAIRNAYYGGQHISSAGIPDADQAFGERLFLSNQDRMNFWVAQDTGDIDGDTSRCFGISAPGNWGDAYAFADSGAIMHLDEFRDCALPGDRLFGSETFSLRTMIHETLHSPFGLADEYCCDSHYFQPSPWPNLYGSQSACLNDVQSLLEWDSVIGDPPRNTSACFKMANGWWTSDTTSDDIMSNKGEFNAADVRRVKYLFDRCASASCRLGFEKDTALSLIGSPADPVPEFEWSTTQKLISVPVTFLSRSVLDVSNIRVKYAAAPMLEAGPPMLQLDFLDIAGIPFRRFHLWHPLLELGTFDPEVGAQGHGPAKWLDTASTTLNLPFSSQLATIQITDLELNQVLKRIDVRPAIVDFCAENLEDEECQAVNSPPMVLYLPMTTSR